MKQFSVPRLARALAGLSLGAAGLMRVAPALALETVEQVQQHDVFDEMPTGGHPEAESEAQVASGAAPGNGFNQVSANPDVQRDCADPDPRVKSLVGNTLCACGLQDQSPKPGYFRNGFCQTSATDHGSHILCGKSTTKFLDSQEKKNNPLRSVIRNDGDEWCFCAVRWRQGYCMGEAVPVVLEATSDKVLGEFRITKRMVDDANDPNNGGVTQKYDCTKMML